MIVRFDSLSSLELPKMTLCNPGSEHTQGTELVSRVVGGICDTSDEEIVFNFNAVSELNFRQYLIPRTGLDENEYVNKMFKAVQNRRLIFIDDIGYFVISSVTTGYENYTYKDVQARSVECEFEQKALPYIENGTYRFLTDYSTQTIGLLNMIVSLLPMWRIGNVDADVAERFRTFEDMATDLNCLGFMMEQMQDAYECIFEFNIIDRIVNVYDQNNYIQSKDSFAPPLGNHVKTNIHLTRDDVINSITINESSEDIYTAVTARGSDEQVMISPLNPLRSNTIYDFSHYLDWMTDGLATAVRTWASKYDGCLEQYKEYNTSLYGKLTEKSTASANLERLNIRLDMYTRCRDNIVAERDAGFVNEYNSVIEATGGETIAIEQDIEDMLAEIEQLRAETILAIGLANMRLSRITSEINTIEQSIDEIVEDVSFQTNFTPAQLNELNCYIFEGEYIDEYVTFTDIMDNSERFNQMSILFDRARDKLRKVSSPTKEFSVDVENFIFSKRFEEWSNQLMTGCIINVEVDAGDIEELFLTNFTINYDDKSFSMTFGNRYNKSDPRSLFDSLTGEVSKTANTLEFIMKTIKPLTDGEYKYVKEAAESSKDISMGGSFTSPNGEVLIDGSGYTSRRYTGTSASGAPQFDGDQIKLSGKSLYITDSGWGNSQTVQTVIGRISTSSTDPTATKYGVNGGAIVGTINLDDNLVIKAGTEVLTAQKLRQLLALIS